MLRNLAFVVGYAVIQMLSTTALVWAADFGTAEEAKAMLERAVAAVKEDKAKALDMFNNGEDGFKDRDLYVWCANASDGIITATPYWNRGKQLRDIEGKRGAPFGETVMENATEGTTKETTYWRRLEIRFAVSATTRNNSPGTYVGLWHFGDIVALQCSARGRHLVRSSRQRIASQSCDQSCDQMVGVGRFELPTPCSRSRCATRLRYTPLAEEPWYIDGSARPGKEAGQGHPCIRCSADAMLVGGIRSPYFWSIGRRGF